jgi:hypothetical protein
MRTALPVVLLLVATSPALAQGTDRRVGSAEGFRRAVAASRPGDRVLLLPGEYRGIFFFKGVHGAAGKPITIAAADPARPPRFVGDEYCVQFSGVSHLVLSDVEFTHAREMALNFDDENVPTRRSHHVTLRNVRVTDVGPKGNADGIKFAGVDDVRVEDCTVERWGGQGSGLDMVGCHRVLVVGCTFRKGGANAVQFKGGSSDVTVLRCRFEDCGERAVHLGGRTDDTAFRPPLASLPANGRYELKNARVEGCTFVGGQAAVGFVGVDGAVVRYNTLYRPEQYVIRILQENTAAGFVPCRDGVFENNVVVFRSERWADGGVNVGPGTAPDTFRFAGNLWYCEDRADRSAPRLPTDEADGVVGKDPQLRDPAKGDLGVRPGSPAADKGAHALPPTK